MILVKIETPELSVIEESKALQIKKTFEPMVTMLETFEESYNSIIEDAKGEITSELSLRAKRLRLDVGKVRIETGKLKDKQKEKIKLEDKAIMGVHNILVWAVSEKEDTLKGIENHFENLEKERIEKLQEERATEVMKYEGQMVVPTLGIMDDDVWKNYINGVKLNHEQKIAAEKKAEEDRIETERINKLHNNRKDSILHLWSYVDHNLAEKNFGEYSDTAWQAIINQLNTADEAEKLRQEKIRLENERLEKEAKERELKAEKLRKENEAKLKIEREKSAIALAKFNAENQAKEKQLQALKDAEQKEKQRLLDIELTKKKAEKAASLAPDKTKLLDLSKRIMSIDMPELKSKEANNIMLSVVDLLSKVDSYINEKVENL